MNRFTLGIAAVAGIGFGSVTHAAISFSDSFTGGPSANWANPADATYASDRANFTDASQQIPSRKYLRTVDTDYHLTDFVATVELTNAGTAWGTAFFGLGEGLNSAPDFGEPTVGQYIAMQFRGFPFTATLGDLRTNGTISPAYAGGNQAVGTTIDVRFTWVAATGTATVDIDLDNDGFDDGTQSVSNLNLTEGRLFFGGANGVIVDNFNVTVVPEPASLALMGLGGLLLLRRKRAN